MKYLLIILSLIILSSCSNTKLNNENKTSSLNKQCYEIPKTGKCRAYFKIYYFNHEKKTCQSAVWGGCGGNIPFKTLESCKKNL